MRFVATAFLALAATVCAEKPLEFKDVKLASKTGQRLLEKSRKLQNNQDSVSNYMSNMQYYQNTWNGQGNGEYYQNNGYGNQGNGYQNQNYQNGQQQQGDGQEDQQNSNSQDQDQDQQYGDDGYDYSQYNNQNRNYGNGGAVNPNYGSDNWLEDYSIKFDGCIKDYDADDGGGYTQAQLLAKFKLCPNNSRKMCRHSGDYVVPMAEFVTAMQGAVQSDENCRMQQEQCYSQCQEAARYGSAYDDDNGNGNGRRLSVWWKWGSVQEATQEDTDEKETSRDQRQDMNQYYQNVDYSQYNGGNYQVAAHNGQYDAGQVSGQYGDYQTAYEAQMQSYQDAEDQYSSNGGGTWYSRGCWKDGTNCASTTTTMTGTNGDDGSNSDYGNSNSNAYWGGYNGNSGNSNAASSYNQNSGNSNAASSYNQNSGNGNAASSYNQNAQNGNNYNQNNANYNQNNGRNANYNNNGNNNQNKYNQNDYSQGYNGNNGQNNYQNNNNNNNNNNGNGNNGRNADYNNYFDEDYCRYDCMSDAGMAYCESNIEVNGANGYNDLNVASLVDCEPLDYFDSANNPLWVGATCRNGGVYLDTFVDSTCDDPAPKGTFEEIIGYNLPDSSLVNGKSLKCSATQTIADYFQAQQYFDNQDEYDEYASQQYSNAVDLCDFLYRDAGKCESHMKKDNKDETSCDFIHRNTKRSAGVWLGYGLGLVVASMFLLAAFFGYTRKEESALVIASVKDSVTSLSNKGSEAVTSLFNNGSKPLKQPLAPVTDLPLEGTKTASYVGPQIPAPEPMTTEPVTPETVPDHDAEPTEVKKENNVV